MQELVVPQIQDLKILTKSEVIEDFENLINNYCEQQHIINNIPRPLICNEMVILFRGLTEHKDDWIRKQINQKYKPMHRVRNGSRSKDGLKKNHRKKIQVESTFNDVAEIAISFVRKELK